MDAPANTWNYFYAGYAVIFFVMGIFIASLIVRWRNLKMDLDALQQMKKE
jgi:uncharacterized membrane-anchored protein YhcB (DUF1043 family)